MMYPDRYASFVTAAIKKFVGRAAQFLKACAPDKLYMTLAQYNSDCVAQRKIAFLEQKRYATRIHSSPSDKLVLIAVHEERHGTYITEPLGCANDC